MNSPKQEQSAATSADLVLTNNDLLNEILLRVPAKSVLSFKLVSKKWLSIISHSSFATRHTVLNANNSDISGLLLRVSFFFGHAPSLRYFYLTANSVQAARISYGFLAFDPGNRGLVFILQSCNGLLLCEAVHTVGRIVKSTRHYYAFNPTTRRFSVIPVPPPGDKMGSKRIQLAFDPAESPHYYVVSVNFPGSWRYAHSSNSEPALLQIYVYSSTSKVWKLSWEERNNGFVSVDFENGVFWNGGLHWISPTGKGLRFVPKQEILRMIPGPPLPENYQERQDFKYFGESGGCLHFIAFITNQNVNDLSTDGFHDEQVTNNSLMGPHFIVFSMERDYSKWSVKYRLALAAMGMVDPVRSISVLSLVEVRSGGEGPFLVIKTSENVVLCYNCKDKTSQELCRPYHKGLTCRVYQHIETLSCV